MNKQHHHFWSIRGLFSIILFMLVLLLLQLLAHLIQQIQQLTIVASWTVILGMLLLALGNLVLIAMLSFLTYITITVIADDPSLRPHFVARYRQQPQLHALFNCKIGRRNLYLSLIASISVLYSIFAPLEIKPQLLLSVGILFSFYLIHWHAQPNSGFPTFVCLLICLFVCSIRISSLQHYELFENNWLFVLSLLLSLLFAAGWILLKVRSIPLGSNSRHWHLSLIAITSVFFIRYFQIALTTINCQYDRTSHHVVHHATVREICPPYEGRYWLTLSYLDKGRECEILMPVPPAIHQQVQVGSRLTIHLHPGLLGWAWYHDDIHTRH